MRPVVIVYNALTLILVVVALILLWRLKSRGIFWAAGFLGAALAGFTIVGAFLSPIDAFGKSQLLCWAVFVHSPVFLVGVVTIARRKNHKTLAVISAVFSISIVMIGLYAFLIEPHWLEISRVTIQSGKLEQPIRVAVIADLQTDHPGEYEKRVFELVAAENPDLILLAGDYLHISDESDYIAAKAALQVVLSSAELEAPLGVYAVRGNTDWGDWADIFAGISVIPFDAISSYDLGPLVLTGLSLQDSGDADLYVSGQNKFHIVLGHKPDFSLGEIHADLLLAGHTHGGQVRLPFIGPLIMVSRVPRSWAAGITQLAPGQHLIVSRGVGMERRNAPRLRFLCRPELVIIDLVPSE